MARIERLRSFLISHPPLVVFIFCIGMTAVAFVSFAYYIKFNNVKKIEVQRVSLIILLFMSLLYCFVCYKISFVSL